ncbi:hypothetical protein FXO21_26870 [Dyadobacter sp. UC 10]|nr:hypothetical protein FXO21_26870 [Dyadobacter sp. UC 10]
MVSVFKTSVKTKAAVRKLSVSLDKLDPIESWSFDLNDCDKILRIESSVEISGLIFRILNDDGFMCEELVE